MIWMFPKMNTQGNLVLQRRLEGSEADLEIPLE